MWFGQTHGGVHDARAVRPDRVSHVPDVDGVQMLVVACLFDEDLWKSISFRASCAQSRKKKSCVAESHLVVQVVQVA